ncbi:MAG: ABC transporter substrate-binding protein, partial [Chthoniobacterales bacterium]
MLVLRLERCASETKAGIGGVATASALAMPAIAQERIEIAMVTTWPRDFPGLGTGAQRFA